MSYLMTRCDYCNKPADGRATTTNGWCKDHLKNTVSIKSTVGKDPKRFKIGGSLTVEGKYEPVQHSTVRTKLLKYPEGYIGWRDFCRKHGKKCDKGSDYTAYRKLRDAGEAELFMGERMVKEGVDWPRGQSKIVYQPKHKAKRSGF